MASVLKTIAHVPQDFGNALRMKPVQGLVWFSCWACWTLGSMQYYFLPFTLASLAKYLDVKETKISEANTTSMLTRSIGAIIFGIASDQYGRKYPLMVCLFFLAIFSMCSGFIHTYGQLLGVRALFGIAYGGLYGMIMATVLEAVPRKARGVVAGFTQQGFAAGYLIASGLHLAMSMAPHQDILLSPLVAIFTSTIMITRLTSYLDPFGWRSLYWLGAGLTVPVAIVRSLTPYYSEATQAISDAEGVEYVDERMAVGGNLSFIAKLKYVFRYHWKPFIYASLLTACFNTMGHGAMDLYPTFLVSQRHLDIKHETWVTIILQSGGVIGGGVGGFLSHKFSPRFVACICIICCAPWLPLWASTTAPWGHLATGAFFFQFFYGCAIGNLGNLLQQLCPHPGLRAAFGGVSYNIGNAISSIAPTIETSLGERFPTKKGTPNYAKTQTILVGIVIALLAVALATMPVKSLNKEWDQEDPNMAIPEHEAKVMPDIEDAEPTVELSEHDAIGGTSTSNNAATGQLGKSLGEGAVHVEKV